MTPQEEMDRMREAFLDGLRSGDSTASKSDNTAWRESETYKRLVLGQPISTLDYQKESSL